MKQIGVSILLYCSDYGEKVPFIEPYEFGDDPLGPYLKNEDCHLNPVLFRADSEQVPGSTEHEFRFAISPMEKANNRWVRKVIDIQSSDDTATMPVAWSLAEMDNSRVCILFADSHARLLESDRFRERVSNGLLGRTDILGGRLNYTLPDSQWPPPTWSVPVKDVLAYIDQAKRELAVKAGK